MNCLLPMTYLANLGCAIGCDLGFNCCVARDLLARDIVEMIFGAKENLSLGSSQQAAMAYHDDYTCFRNERRIELPRSMLSESRDSVQKYLTAQLLELIPSGPSGVKDMDWTFA